MSQSQPPTLSKGMPKWLKRSLWGLGFFFALLVLAWVILYFVANSQLENTLESLRKG